MIEAVFSLKYAKIGEPTIKKKYLKNEKYSNIKITQIIMPLSVTTKFKKLLLTLFKEFIKKPFSHSIKLLAVLPKKYMPTKNKMQ